jgi:hypothetical protein
VPVIANGKIAWKLIFTRNSEKSAVEEIKMRDKYFAVVLVING